MPSSCEMNHPSGPCGGASIQGLPAVGSATHAGQLAGALFLFETVVIRQFLPGPDISAGEEDQVGLPIQLQYFGVH